MSGKEENLVFACRSSSKEMAARLIFLVSQPRAGSTMLQRILGGHQDVHTTSEPWFMLHPLYALRPNSIRATYDNTLASAALRAFLDTLPEGDDAYYQAVGQMASYLYGRALANTGKSRFLDKTPRYYTIIPELARVFPQAKFIFLLRHPLAVLSSVCRTWVGDNLRLLSGYRADLLEAPGLMLEGVRQLGANQIAVRYEDLLEAPDTTLQRVCTHLDLGYSAELVEYGKQGLQDWKFGDQRQVWRYRRPMSEHGSRWIEDLNQPQFWRLASDYLRHLGRQTVNALGFDFDEARDLLRDAKPGSVALFRSSSLASVINRPMAHRVSPREIPSQRAA